MILNCNAIFLIDNHRVIGGQWQPMNVISLAGVGSLGRCGQPRIVISSVGVGCQGLWFAWWLLYFLGAMEILPLFSFLTWRP